MKFLDLKPNGKTNAHGIIYWDSTQDKIVSIYDWCVKINIEDYLHTVSDGNYIYHGPKENTKEQFILRTQAKFNNGIIERKKGKKSGGFWVPKCGSYFSSWNAVATQLDRIYNLDHLPIIIWTTVLYSLIPKR